MPIDVDKVVDRKDISKEQILAILKQDTSLAFTQKELAKLTGSNQSTISRTLLKLLKDQKIWKKFEIKGRGRPTAYYYARRGKNE